LNDFVSTLMEMRNGSVAADCSRKLAEVILAVCETGKQGKITLQINVKPAKVNLGKVTEVELKHTCKTDRPEHDAGYTLFFPTEDGSLSRQDPNQIALDLREEERKGVRQ
jgi:hypothetical protein